MQNVDSESENIQKFGNIWETLDTGKIGNPGKKMECMEYRQNKVYIQKLEYRENRKNRAHRENRDCTENRGKA